MFETFILSHFNFCPIVWHYCNMSHIRSIACVQKRASRMVYNDFDSSYYELRVASRRPLLYVQRIRIIALEMFKIYHGIGPKYMQALITKSNCSYSTRNAKRVELPQYKSIRYGYNSFTYNGAFIWNNLPNEIKQEFDIKVLND